MPDLRSLGIGSFDNPAPAEPVNQLIVRQHPLRHVLAFTRRTIDDVVNSPVAKNEVLGYYKLHKWIGRGIEIRELEDQWNSAG